MKWYKIEGTDEANIKVPNIQILGAESIERTRTSGTTDKEYFWFQYPHEFEYHQSLKVTMYCTFNFRSFPFDSHYCDLTLLDTDSSSQALIFSSTLISYQNKNTQFGEDWLKLDQSRIPCDIFIGSLKPFFLIHTGFNYSSAGMRVLFHRNNINLLIGSFYGPTLIFVLLSQVSYSIDIHMVCI